MQHSYQNDVFGDRPTGHCFFAGRVKSVGRNDDPPHPISLYQTNQM
jgi:hypothetical protein